MCTKNDPQTSNYPSTGGGSPIIVSNNSGQLIMKGFARACSVFDQGCSGSLKGPLDRGGWDGWISLSDTTGAGKYGIILHTSNNKFGGFAWGGGFEDGGALGNVSPQSPGWITFDPNIGNGDGNCFDGLQNGDETSPDQGGRCDTIVKLCGSDPTCGENKTGISCTPSQYPVINTDITWNVTANPAGSSYVWSLKKGNPPVNAVLNTDYSLISGSLSSQSFKIKYLTPGPWYSDVQVDGAGHCDATVGMTCPAGTDGLCYTVGDKSFIVSSDPTTVNTEFIRSIRSITTPDAKISVKPIGGFTGTVTISFDNITGPAGDIKSGDSLTVEPQFWQDDSTKPCTADAPCSTIPLSQTNGVDYGTAWMRLKLTKNQSSTQSLPSSKNYSINIKGDGGGLSNRANIQLIMNNPSGGVIEK